MLGGIREERKKLEQNQLEWLFLHHIGMITEHFRKRLEEYLFQPLEVIHIKKNVTRR